MDMDWPVVINQSVRISLTFTNSLKWTNGYIIKIFIGLEKFAIFPAIILSRLCIPEQIIYGNNDIFFSIKHKKA